MATHTDTSKLATYQAGTFPSLGDEKRFIVAELSKISICISNIISVMKLMEDRMNTNGLT